MVSSFPNIFDADEFSGDVGKFYKTEFFKKKIKGTPKVQRGGVHPGVSPAPDIFAANPAA